MRRKRKIPLAEQGGNGEAESVEPSLFSRHGVGYYMRAVHNVSVKLAQLEIEPYGINVTMWVLIRALFHAGSELTQRELVVHAELAQSSISAQLFLLVKLGLISVKSSPTDRRKAVYALTAKGCALAKRLEPISVDLAKVALRGLSAEEIVLLRTLLPRLRQNLASKIEHSRVHGGGAANRRSRHERPETAETSPRRSTGRRLG